MREKCRYADRCSAPLCPLDDNIEKRIWYPDEPICVRRDFSHLLFIQNQRKIAKKVMDRDTFYTYDMLNRRMRITKTMEGLNPDRGNEGIQAWYRVHKGISDETYEKMRETALRNLVKR